MSAYADVNGVHMQGDHDFVPNTTHMQVTRRADLLLPMLAEFLD